MVTIGVSVGIGSKEEEEFWGCGTLRSTKSFALLSVSSPFPFNSSIPPAVIVWVVDDESAFLSMLPVEAGFGETEFSFTTALPMPTLSTSVILLSLYRLIVESFEKPVEYVISAMGEAEPLLFAIK